LTPKTATAGTPIEALVRRDRWLTTGALAAATVLCWAWIVAMARDMYGPMTGASAWMMGGVWDPAHLLLLFAMWVAMMAGMMLPSAAPALLLYAGVIRRSPDGEGGAPAHVYAFAGGYLLVWTIFSGAATVLQRVLARAFILSPMMEPRSPLFAGILLLAAGAFQFTPYKRACLNACRNPAEFLARHWRPGVAGGFYLGTANGLYCLGCCWALMLLLFVGGVMNLWCIAALTIFVLLEKVAPLGAQGGRLSGLLLAALGLWSLLRGIA
jgi:predicted metal-binding membrane protein